MSQQASMQGGAPGGSAVPAPRYGYDAGDAPEPVHPLPPTLTKEELTTPTGFALGFLEVPLYPWQVEILSWYELSPEDLVMGAALTPNGAGKSSGIVAVLALWWLFVNPKGRVRITSASSMQLDTQLWPAMERHRARFGGWKWNVSPYCEITTPTGGSLIAHTTNDPGKAEGHHPAPDKSPEGILLGPLLMIVDEAKSVEKDIFDAINRCGYNALLLVSSSGLREGDFYGAFTKDRELYRTRRVSLNECPHIDPQKIARVIKKYGENAPLTRSILHGEFMEDGDVAYIFPRRVVDRAVNDPPMKRRGARVAFCDFAAGGDENVLALRDGNTVEIKDAWHEKDTMVACARFVMLFKKYNLEAEAIFADEGGLGKPMCDRLASMGWAVNRVNNGAAAYDQNYQDRGAEMWHDTAAAMDRGEVLLVSPDEETIEQLKSRRSIPKATGKIAAEPKPEMKKRGVESPDRADALCGAWSCGEYSATDAVRDIFEEYEEAKEEMAWATAGVGNPGS